VYLELRLQTQLSLLLNVIQSGSMKARFKLILVCLIIGAITANLAVLSWLTASGNSSSEQGIPNIDFPSWQGVTKSAGYYNVSLSFSNLTDPLTLTNIFVDPWSIQNYSAPTFYFNGTLENHFPLTALGIGDSLHVSLTFPCSEYASGTNLDVDVVGAFGMANSAVPYNLGTSLILP
jgi:hypothetical protein